MREAENETLDTGKFGVRVKEVEIENENEDIVVAVHIHHIIVHPLRITLHILTAPSTKTMICTAMAIQTPQFHEQLGTHAITIVTHDRIQLHLVGALSPGKIRFVSIVFRSNSSKLKVNSNELTTYNPLAFRKGCLEILEGIFPTL